MNKDKKPWFLKKRKAAPPPERVHRDRKKEARRTVARGPAAEELEWGPKTSYLAERLGAETVTVHPNRSKKPRQEHQQTARRHLAEVQRRTTVILSVETFEGKGRIFTIQEIIDFGLPMTLDTSHIREDKQIIKIIESYRHNIPVVHLSARNEREQHLPVDRFCLDVVRYLVRLGWAGNIVLEYLPDYHDQLRPDIEKVRRVVEGEKTH